METGQPPAKNTSYMVKFDLQYNILISHNYHVCNQEPEFVKFKNRLGFCFWPANDPIMGENIFIL